MVSAKIGALCAGYGGLDLAVKSVIDAELAWVSDIDPGACKILAHRFPDAPNIGDMTAVDWSAVEPVDVLTGGTPCQDLSHAGRRAGMTEGTRSNLWVAMREAIAVLRPSLVIWENVGGAYSARADSDVERESGLLGSRADGPALRALGRVLGDLATLGFDAEWRGLRAADVGAPHGRLRVFVVAWPAAADAASNPRRIDDRDHETAADAANLGHQRRRTARDGRHGPTDGSLLPTPTTRDTKGHNQRRDRTRLTGALLPTPRAGDGIKGGPNQRGSSGDLMLPSAVMRLLPTPVVTDVTGTRNATAGRSAGARPFSVGTTLGDVAYADRWGDYSAAIQRWEALTRPSPDPTRPDGRGGKARLNPAFSEWMMGLPAGWVTDVPGITRNEALKALGNGVVPQQAAAAVGDCLAASEAAA